MSCVLAGCADASPRARGKVRALQRRDAGAVAPRFVAIHRQQTTESPRATPVAGLLLLLGKWWFERASSSRTCSTDERPLRLTRVQRRR